MTTLCSIRQPPSPTMRRRLRMSRDRGWLVRLHGIDCSQLTGTVRRLDVRAMFCLLETPGSLCPEHEIDLDGICEVQAVSVAMMQEGRLLARFALIAPWRGGASDAQTLLADLMSGTVCAGDQGTLLLNDGARRPGAIKTIAGQLCHIELG